MPAAFIVITIICGICLFGTALLNMGVGGIILCILIAIVYICDRVTGKRREEMEEGEVLSEWKS